jgi:hypothetical protein
MSLFDKRAELTEREKNFIFDTIKNMHEELEVCKKHSNEIWKKYHNEIRPLIKRFDAEPVPLSITVPVTQKEYVGKTEPIVTTPDDPRKLITDYLERNLKTMETRRYVDVGLLFHRVIKGTPLETMGMRGEEIAVVLEKTGYIKMEGKKYYELKTLPTRKQMMDIINAITNKEDK